MKLVFLDIDGVLVTPAECMQKMVRIDGDLLHHFNPEAVSAINHVTETTGAKFVISSTWRMHGIKILSKHFKNEAVLGEIVSITPRLNSYERGLEIMDWLANNESFEVDAFSIVDDEGDAAHTDELRKHFVKTLWRDWDKTGEAVGFTMKHAEQMVSILNVEK